MRLLAATVLAFVVTFFSAEANSQSTSVRVNCLAIDKSDSTLASGNENGYLSLWDTASGKQKFNGKISRFAINTLSYNHDGKILVSGDSSIAQLDPAKRTPKHLQFISKNHSSVRNDPQICQVYQLYSSGVCLAINF